LTTIPQVNPKKCEESCRKDKMIWIEIKEIPYNPKGRRSVGCIV
jgi:hypothetical protein